MRVGLVARADDRGIGTMTWEFHRGMRPAATLIVRELAAERLGFVPHLDRYPGATWARWDPETSLFLDEDAVRDFLTSVDVVYLVETPYDWRFFDWCREAGVASVLHVMPEFWHWSTSGRPRPDAFWLPTGWRRHLVDADTTVVPVPCPTAPHPSPPAPTAAHYVHVVGRRAAHDRNGTGHLYRAARRARRSWTVRVETQDATAPDPMTPRVRLHAGGRADRWRLYDDASTLVMPRLYGGLCLPVLEAMARGLAVVMPAVEPQASEWPIVPVRANPGQPIATPAGRVATCVPDLRDLTAVLDRLADELHVVRAAQEASLRYAGEHDWAHLRPVYEAELANVVEAAR